MSSFANNIENGVAVARTIEGREIRFGILSMRDFGVMRTTMPEDERKGATFGDIWEWARSPMGAIWTVTLAAQKYDPLFTEKQVDSLGNVMFVYRLATDILEASAGEAKAEGGAEGNVTTNPTGQS
jgi:hypothetical protein